MTIRNGSYANMLVVRVIGQFIVEEQVFLSFSNKFHCSTKASRQAKTCIAIEIWFINSLVLLTINVLRTWTVWCRLIPVTVAEVIMLTAAKAPMINRPTIHFCVTAEYQC